MIAPGDGDRAHGTVNGYANLGCRGEDCAAAWATYARERRRSDPIVSKSHKVAKRKPEVHPEPDRDEEPYVFQREPVKRIEMTGEVVVPADQEPMLPWMTERLVVLGYNPEVKVLRRGNELVIRCALALMPTEAKETGWADGVVREAIEWAKGDPRLVSPCP